MQSANTEIYGDLIIKGKLEANEISVNSLELYSSEYDIYVRQRVSAKINQGTSYAKLYDYNTYGQDDVIKVHNESNNIYFSQGSSNTIHCFDGDSGAQLGYDSFSNSNSGIVVCQNLHMVVVFGIGQYDFRLYNADLSNYRTYPTSNPVRNISVSEKLGIIAVLIHDRMSIYALNPDLSKGVELLSTTTDISQVGYSLAIDERWGKIYVSDYDNGYVMKTFNITDLSRVGSTPTLPDGNPVVWTVFNEYFIYGYISFGSSMKIFKIDHWSSFQDKMSNEDFIGSPDGPLDDYRHLGLLEEAGIIAFRTSSDSDEIKVTSIRNDSVAPFTILPVSEGIGGLCINNINKRIYFIISDGLWYFTDPVLSEEVTLEFLFRGV